MQDDEVRRGPHLLAPAVYGVAAAAHSWEIPAVYGLPATALAALGAYTRAMNLPDGGEPVRVGVAALAAGGWVTAATQWGVAAGPYNLMTWLAAATYGLTYWAYRRDPGVREMLAWQQAREDWYIKASMYGLSGAHLVDWQETRLGEQFDIDTVGTGHLASTLVGAALEERIAEKEKLPASRVKTRRGHIAGRMTISLRYKDPWADPLPHPLLDSAPEIPLPAVADAREPVIIGMDPETGRALQIPLWDEDGAKRVMIVAITRGGKTVLLSDLLERTTAADNVFTIGINVSKAKEMRRWRPALGASACGPDERVKALRILELVRAIIDWRGAQETDEAVFVPRRSQPLVVVGIDEMDTLVAESDGIGMAIRREVAYIVSKGGSEGVALVAAGQRGVVSHFGSGDIKRMFDVFAMLKSAGEGEIRHVLGELGLTMPSMMTYGEGHPGVALVTDLAGHWTAGRTWRLDQLPDIDRLAVDRQPCPLEPALVEFLGDKLTAVTGAGPLKPRPRRPVPVVTEAPMHVEEQLPQDRAAAQRATARARLREIAVPPTVQLSPAEATAAAVARRRQAAEQTHMSAEVRSLLLRLISAPEGTTTRAAEKAMQDDLGLEVGVSKTGAWRCLDALRFEGVAELRGKGRAARWHLAATVPTDTPPELPADPVFDHERAVEAAEEAVEEEVLDHPDDHRE
ncbi:hypothetical protein [Sphaerisporangium sp. TRM90804]|uniref:hypothetical protein n=1 Tax=Sphaerisporangium sp. TRM90804 TaxID=3031113 RepID=UPI0024473E82|nr:hypothetical protein [Sphaerisporangium sp. TRM90804]MDH2424713.1 hypothetical protein [Sphaerisporangium sp. TRM90804]